MFGTNVFDQKPSLVKTKFSCGVEVRYFCSIGLHILRLQSMLPHPVVKDVGEDSQEDEVFHRAAGAEYEDFHGEDAGTEDEVEVLSSSCCRKGSLQKSRLYSAQNSSSSQSPMAVKGDGIDKGSTSSTKPTRRRSKAVIEAEDEDDEAQPAENLSRTHSPPDVVTLISKIADGADTPSPRAGVSICSEKLIFSCPTFWPN